MTKKGGLALLLAGVAFSFQPLPVVAADKGASLPPGALFRYIDKRGNTVLTSSLNDEALYAGYQVLTSKGDVVETVAPGIPESDRAAIKAQREREAHDQQLLRMYTSPEGALRNRNRQIESIQLKMSYARNDLSRQKAKLEDQISRAADHEKRGEAVPSDTQDLITLYGNQVQNTEAALKQYQADIDNTNQRYGDIISRLEELTGKKVVDVPPAGKQAKP